LLYPHIGRRTSDPAIRRMTTTPYPYLVVYEATDTEIIIHAVRHAARNPSGMPGSACRRSRVAQTNHLLLK
jgi:toxin ParE1/3/4